ALSLIIITAALNRVEAANPPTNYTAQTTPYNGTETWYCEDVTHTADKSCSFSNLATSITTLSNLASATNLTSVGILVSGQLSTGFTIQASNVTWTGT